MTTASPFALLQQYDQRCRDNARGSPSGEIVEDDWVGIGFYLNGKPLLAKMTDVTEILPPPDTIRVPGVRNWVSGIANVRGALMPILDMQAFLGDNTGRGKKDSRVLVINKENILAGLLVQEVSGMRRFKPDKKKQTVLPEMGSLEPYLDGIFDDNRTQWSVFSVEKLVTHDRFLNVVE